MAEYVTMDQFPLPKLRAECEAVTGVPMSQRRLSREAGLSPAVVWQAETYKQIGVRAAAMIAEVLSRELGRYVSWKEIVPDDHPDAQGRRGGE